MSTKEQRIAVIALRIMAIYLVVQIINLIPSWVSTIATPFMADTQLPVWLILLGFVLLVGSFILPVIIWVTSKRLAKFVVGDGRVTDLDNVSSSSIGNIIFAAVGLLVFLLAFPDLVVWMCQAFMALEKSSPSYQAPSPSWWLLLSLLLKTALSLLLILKSSTIFRLIKSK